jgi:hypothetical protein
MPTQDEASIAHPPLDDNEMSSTNVSADVTIVPVSDVIQVQAAIATTGLSRVEDEKSNESSQPQVSEIFLPTESKEGVEDEPEKAAVTDIAKDIVALVAPEDGSRSEKSEKSEKSESSSLREGEDMASVPIVITATELVEEDPATILESL